MTKRMYFLALIVLISAFVSGCAALRAHEAAMQEQRALVASFCRASGMTQRSPVRRVELWKGSQAGRNLILDLETDGKIRTYEISIEEGVGIFSVMPLDLSIMKDVQIGTSSPGISRATKSRCLAAVARVNKVLQWRISGRPTICESADGFLVTYISRVSLLAGGLDPYISFMVSKTGIVFGAFFGA